MLRVVENARSGAGDEAVRGGDGEQVARRPRARRGGDFHRVRRERARSTTEARGGARGDAEATRRVIGLVGTE